MFFTALERMLKTERLRQRAARMGGFSVPAMNEVGMEAVNAPLLATNMKGTFLPTRPSRDGVARYGFSHVPVATDDALLAELHRSLSVLSEREGWSNRCKSVLEALQRMQGFGLEPKTIVVGPARLAEVSDIAPEDARAAMRDNREVATFEGATVLLADLSGTSAFVCAAPPLVGYYTRVGEHLGILLQRVNQTLVVVA